ncbi:MAG: VWA domain-containing protein [bacterium]|nr:VWA domain-containing protein [bacterium]
MMDAVRWDHPPFLLALLAAPALAAFFVWAAGRRARALRTFVAASLLPVVAPDVDPRRRRLRAALVVAAVACLGLALGGPRWGFRWEELRREGIDIVVALDTSRSMLATDVKPNRLARAKLAIRDLADAARDDRLALVPFAGSAFVQCPLTLDHGAFLESLQATDVGIIPRGGTALAVAIDTSLGAFEGREGRHQAIVLVTDGESHEGDWKAAVARAKERGVAIFTVGLGTTEGELLPAEQGPGFFKDRRGQAVKSRLDETTLEQVAVDTGGVYLHLAGTGPGLAELYRDHIAELDPRQLGSTLEKRYEARYRWPLLVALVLLLLEPLVSDRRSAAGGRGRRFWGAARAPAAALVIASLSIGWLDPNAKAREGVTLYREGRFPEAAQAWNEALVDTPEVPALHYDLGAAFYRLQKWDEALGSYEKVPAAPGDDPARAARTWYNVGNTRVRRGEASEQEKPQETLQQWGEALVAYRRALTADPTLTDAKYNLELVAKKVAALEEKLKQQEQEQEQQRGEEQPKDRQPQDDRQQAGEEPKPEDRQPEDGQPPSPEQPPEQPAEQEPPQQPDEQGEPQPRDDEPPQEQAGDQAPQPEAEEAPSQAAPSEAGEPSKEQPQGDDSAGERRDGEMSPEEAAALLDAQRAEEVSPEDVARRMQGGRVAGPAQDW